MRIYSVESKNLFFVNFLDFKIHVFSPRELFYSVIGIYLLVQSMQGMISGIFGLLGFIIFIFGYIPYKFLPFEKKLINFLRFHLKNNYTSKKANKESSLLVGLGETFVSDETDDKEELVENYGPEIIKITNLEEPYTIKLKTNTKEQFLPVSVFVNDMKTPVANTSTDRRGNISCTVLIISYDTYRFCAKDDSGNILYDQKVTFTPS